MAAFDATPDSPEHARNFRFPQEIARMRPGHCIKQAAGEGLSSPELRERRFAHQQVGPAGWRGRSAGDTGRAAASRDGRVETNHQDCSEYRMLPGERTFSL